MADPVTVGGGGTVAGSVLTLLGLWLRAKLMSGAATPPSIATALQDEKEIQEMDKRLTRLEGDIAALREGQTRNESGIQGLNAKIDALAQAANTAQIELATTLGRIEGEMRARRERGPVTP